MKRPIFFLPLVFLHACSDNSQNAAPALPPVPVCTYDVMIQDVPLYFEAMGTISSFQTAEVKPQINGIITGIHFTEGDWVEKGSLLYTIEEAPYEIKVKEARAMHSQNLAHFSNAKKKLERYKSLTKQDLIAKVDWDEMECKVALCEAAVQASDATLAAATLNLEYCKIKAPISGRTGKTTLHVGNMVSPALTLVNLSQEKPLYVDFTINEKELQRLPSHQTSVKVYLAGNEECLGEGGVTFLDHNIDPKSGMLSARALLKVQHKSLWPGQSVRVHLFFDKKEQAKLVPLKAIKTNQQGPYIFVVKEDNTVELKNIKLGQEEKGMIIVEEGLEGASKIVTEGQSRLFSGSKIEEYQK